MATPTLKHVFTMSITPKAPVNVGETPRGKTNWFEITGGTITGVDGSHIADVHTGGGDYLTRFVEDNVAEVDLRLIAKDSNGELLRLTVTGFDYLDRATMLALDGRAGEDPGSSATDITEPYGFETLKCSTASKEYRWMNFAVLIARRETQALAAELNNRRPMKSDLDLTHKKQQVSEDGTVYPE
ncbi:hypothetical protein ACHAPV_009136 [Trichoderma viride]